MKRTGGRLHKMCALVLGLSLLLMTISCRTADGQTPTVIEAYNRSTGEAASTDSPDRFAAVSAAISGSIITETTKHPETYMSGDTNKQTNAMRAIEVLEALTLEEKIYQLFFIVPDILAGAPVIYADEVSEAVSQHPVGGFLITGSNIQSDMQLRSLIDGLKDEVMSVIGIPPFIGVDEEGGRVARLGNSSLELPAIPAMAYITDAGAAKQAGQTIGTYLSDYGFTVDFAPVLDVLINPDNLVIGDRSFGRDAERVADLGLAFIEGLQANGIAATAKHFPGHGATAGDTHKGAAVSTRAANEIRGTELVPFRQAIDAGIEFIMVGHMSIPSLSGTDMPTSLSKAVVTDLLRSELGFDGIVIIDALNMQAITDFYSAGDAVVAAILAGVDVLLAPGDLSGAFNGVLTAVQDGTLPEARIDESVLRILELKLRQGESE